MCTRLLLTVYRRSWSLPDYSDAAISAWLFATFPEKWSPAGERFGGTLHK